MSMLRNLKLGNLLIALPCLTLMLMSVSSVSSEINKAQWHGFISQGAIKTSDNRFFGDSENLSFDFTDIAFGINWRPLTRLHLSTQAIYRKAGKTSPDGIKLDYGIVDYNFINNERTGLGSRAGRVKNPYGFYNETRDVAASRPSILLPQSIYPDELRDAFHSSDSVALYAYYQFDNTLLNLDIVYGKPIFNQHVEDILLQDAPSLHFDHQTLLVARAILDYDGGRMRGGVSYSNISADLVSPLVMNLKFQLLSFEYNADNWQIVSEYQERSFDLENLPPPKLTAQSYYLQFIYSLSARWRFVSRYDVFYFDKDDKSGRTFDVKSDAYSNTHTMGIQYKMNESWLLSGELHHIDGSAWLSDLENPNRDSLEGNWNLFTAQVSYQFRAP